VHSFWQAFIPPLSMFEDNSAACDLHLWPEFSPPYEIDIGGGGAGGGGEGSGGDGGSVGGAGGVGGDDGGKGGGGEGDGGEGGDGAAGGNGGGGGGAGNTRKQPRTESMELWIAALMGAFRSLTRLGMREGIICTMSDAKAPSNGSSTPKPLIWTSVL